MNSLRPVLAYHPEIPIVAEDGRRLILRADLEDWASDDDVLHDLAQRASVETVGELVDTVLAGDCLGAECRVEAGVPRFSGKPVPVTQRLV